MAIVLKADKSRNKKKGYKDSLIIIPYFLTFANASFGFLSVIESIQENFFSAAFCIGIAALMDLFDGRLARAFGCQSYIGEQLDSLCDAISFCFAPTILIYSYFDFPVKSWGICFLVIYLCAGLFRLASFDCNEQKVFFSGLSTPVAAFFISSLILYQQWFINNYPFIVRPAFVCIALAGVAFLMVSSIPFYSFKTITVTPWVLYVALVTGLFLAFLGLSYNLPLIFLALLFYIISSLLYVLCRRHWRVSKSSCR